jgi:acetyltransferase-like isoleucine patch superfamily enzyme
MKAWLFYLKFILKGGYTNSFKKLKFAATSWIGKTVSIYFEPGGTPRQTISLGEGVRVSNFSDLTVGTNDALILKDYTTLNTHCKIIGEVTIERYCLLSANIFISSGQHYATRFPHLLIRQQDEKILGTEEGQRQHSKPVHIEEDVWIGFGVFIKQGVTVGRGAVIGANAVVLHDVGPYEIVGGNPAKKIKDRLAFAPPVHIRADIDEHRPYFYRGFDHYGVHRQNPSGAPGMFAFEESTIAIPATPTGTIQCRGFITGAQPITVEVSVDGHSVGTYTLQGATFDLNVHLTGQAPSEGKINPFSFITFAVPYDKRLCLGFNSIKIV